MTVTIRAYRPDTADADATMRVFRAAVTRLAANDYSAEQIATWAGHTGTVGQWDARRTAVHTWVAADSGARPATVAGFIDVNDDGYIDMLFVAPDYARQGVATALLVHVERFAAARDVASLTVHASITARPFFARHGFRVAAVRHPRIGDVEFVNYLMIKPLEPPAHSFQSAALRAQVGKNLHVGARFRALRRRFVPTCDFGTTGWKEIRKMAEFRRCNRWLRHGCARFQLRFAIATGRWWRRRRRRATVESSFGRDNVTT